MKHYVEQLYSAYIVESEIFIIQTAIVRSS